MSDRLGTRVRDVITGFEGVVTGHVHYLTGCSQLLLAPAAKDGALIASEWFDEQRCSAVDGAERIVLDNGAKPGSDRAAPRR